MQSSFDFDAPVPAPDLKASATTKIASRSAGASPTQKARRGLLSYQAGRAAEDIVARQYSSLGLQHKEKCWRGGGAEIDLIFKDGDTVVFVEVKKSTTFERAISRITPRQIGRIHAAATAYVAGEPKGQLTDMRFDVALVDGQGRTQILENALIAA